MSDQIQKSELIMYQTEDGVTKIGVRLENDTVWLTQAQMADLFQRDRTVITKHINNIFEEQELDKESNVQIMHIANSDKPTFLYSLDMIISVGYRVKSQRGVQFRIWANKILKEYIIKGFSMDDERLKGNAGGNYWKELLDRIRDIRSSEKVLYRQVLDLYAQSVDYDPHSKESVRFFKIVQNKLHYAAHGHTAAEVIHERVDANKPFMGLTSFQGELPSINDIGIAKNYLSADELKILNNLVSGYFDFAEIQAMRHIPLYMKDYVKQLDNVISSIGGQLLEGAGSVSHEEAMEKAKAEYRKYQAKTITPVESAYLESIKEIEKSVNKKQNHGKKTS